MANCTKCGTLVDLAGNCDCLVEEMSTCAHYDVKETQVAVDLIGELNKKCAYIKKDILDLEIRLSLNRHKLNSYQSCIEYLIKEEES